MLQASNQSLGSPSNRVNITARVRPLSITCFSSFPFRPSLLVTDPSPPLIFSRSGQPTASPSPPPSPTNPSSPSVSVPGFKANAICGSSPSPSPPLTSVSSSPRPSSGCYTGCMGRRRAGWRSSCRGNLRRWRRRSSAWISRRLSRDRWRTPIRYMCLGFASSCYAVVLLVRVSLSSELLVLPDRAGRF